MSPTDAVAPGNAATSMESGDANPLNCMETVSSPGESPPSANVPSEPVVVCSDTPAASTTVTTASLNGNPLAADRTVPSTVAAC